MSATVLVWVNAKTLAAARTVAERALALGIGNVVVAGDVDAGLSSENVVCLAGLPSRSAALEHALLHARGDVLLMQEPDAAFHAEDLAPLAEKVERGEADVVVGRRSHVPRQDAVVARLAHLAMPQRLGDLLCGQKAIRLSALRGLTLRSTKDDVEAELLLRLAAQQYRFAEVPIGAITGPRPLAQLRAFSRVFVGGLSGEHEAEGHDGAMTLHRLESGARNYNAWLGRRFAEHAGRRVLEIGAGLGTITAHLAEGRERVVALEADAPSVQKLRNRFRGSPVVEPWLSNVEGADEAHLKAQHFDTIVLSNVLEHIADDFDAVAKFGRLLEPGGVLLVLVPALPSLFGALDEAVGHHRRYTPDGLRSVIEANGFLIEKLEWMNLAGIPGWFVNGRLFRRRSLPPLQLRLYDRVAPLLAAAESKVSLPVGMSLFCVARRTGKLAGAA